MHFYRKYLKQKCPAEAGHFLYLQFTTKANIMNKEQGDQIAQNIPGVSELPDIIYKDVYDGIGENRQLLRLKLEKNEDKTRFIYHGFVLVDKPTNQ